MGLVIVLFPDRPYSSDKVEDYRIQPFSWPSWRKDSGQNREDSPGEQALASGAVASPLGGEECASVNRAQRRHALPPRHELWEAVTEPRYIAFAFLFSWATLVNVVIGRVHPYHRPPPMCSIPASNVLSAHVCWSPLQVA
jgi:hypothetical protein